MKHYPTQIFLTVNDPKTGRPTMRWYPVQNEIHEKFVRGQVKAAQDAIAAAREKMAAAVGGNAQKLIVESLRDEFVEFHHREASHGRNGKAESPVEGSGAALLPSEPEKETGLCETAAASQSGGLS
jgi:hypothetical protein